MTTKRMQRFLTCAVSAWLALPVCSAWADDGSSGGGQPVYC